VFSVYSYTCNLLQILAGLFKGCFKRVIKEFKKTLQESIDKGKEPNISGALKQVRVVVLQAHSMSYTGSIISPRDHVHLKKRFGRTHRNTLLIFPHVKSKFVSSPASYHVLQFNMNLLAEATTAPELSYANTSPESFTDHVCICRSTSRAACSTVWQQETGGWARQQ
jgi:hypothetical protein